MRAVRSVRAAGRPKVRSRSSSGSVRLAKPARPRRRNSRRPIGPGQGARAVLTALGMVRSPDASDLRVFALAPSFHYADVFRCGHSVSPQGRCRPVATVRAALRTENESLPENTRYSVVPSGLIHLL